MNNKEFTLRLQTLLKEDGAKTRKLVDDTLDALAELLDEGKDVQIHGFGTFEIKKRRERIMDNPLTKKKMLVPPRMSVTFRPSDTIKERLKR